MQKSNLLSSQKQLKQKSILFNSYFIYSIYNHSGANAML